MSTIAAARLADRAAARIEKRMSDMTRPRKRRRATIAMSRFLAFEIAIVVCVGSMLFIH